MFKFVKLAVLIGSCLAFVAVSISDADARNRTGSKRTYSGHGKGSHYVGGK